MKRFALTPLRLGVICYLLIVSGTGWAVAPPFAFDNYPSSSLAAKDFEGMIESPSAKTYSILLNATSPLTLKSLSIQTASGTCNVSIKINGSAITFYTTSALITTVSPVSASSTLLTVYCNNAIANGDKIEMTISSVSSATDFAWSIGATR